MNFVRRAWKLLVAVKDGLVLLLMLIFFGVLAAALSARPGKSVAPGALVLDLKGSIVEQPAPVSPQVALTGGARAREYRLRDLVAALDAAVDDARVKAVVLDLDGFTGGGQVALADVGAALDKVRAKKPVLAFATGYTDDSYQLAAHASEIWLDPMGLAVFAGPGGSRLYYKGLLERVGANVHVYRVGQFKSAVEPYILDRASAPAKAANEALAAALWQGWKENVARARPKAKLATYTTDPAAPLAGGDLAQAALAAGIVDHVDSRTAFVARVTQIAGAGSGRNKSDFARIELRNWIGAHPRAGGDGSIGVVTVAGVISDGEAPAGSAGGDTVATIIDRAAANGKVKALVLRVDSPGGSALASEKIRAALLAAKARGLPVTVSMGNVAASGGYWVSMAGDRVFAEPTTITGSIGVFGIIPTFERSLGKVGITTDGVRSTAFSGQPDIFGGTDPAFDKLIQTSVENTYGKFIALVSGARRLPAARVNEIAQGRVWDGGSARQLGLIDQFGGIDDAIADAARRAKLDPAKAHAVWLDKEPGWREALASLFADTNDDGETTDALTTMANAQVAALAQAVTDAQSLITGPAVQVRCLECPATHAARAEPASLFAMLRSGLGL